MHKLLSATDNCPSLVSEEGEWLYDCRNYNKSPRKKVRIRIVSEGVRVGSNYRILSTYLEKKDWTNSVDPDQTLQNVFGYLISPPYLSLNTTFTLSIATSYLRPIFILKYYIDPKYKVTLIPYHTCPKIPYLLLCTGTLYFLTILVLKYRFTQSIWTPYLLTIHVL